MRLHALLPAFAVVVLATAAAFGRPGQDPPAPVPPPAEGTETAPAQPAAASDTEAPKPETLPRKPLQVGEALAGETLLTLVPAPAETPSAEPPSPVSVRSLAGDPRRPVVLLFWSRGCPVSRRYHTPFAALAKDFGAQAVFALVVTNHGDVPAEARQALTDASIALPLYADKDQAAAVRLGVRVTPTALVFDAGGVLRYRGPVDDDRRAKNREPVQHLREALVAVTSGRTVEGAEPRAFGCALRRAPKKSE